MVTKANLTPAHSKPSNNKGGNMTQQEQSEFNPEKDNPCWGCPHRAYSKYDWQNICLLDENEVCVREQ